MPAADPKDIDIDQLIAEDQEFIREVRRQNEEGMRVLGRAEFALETIQKTLDRLAEKGR